MAFEFTDRMKAIARGEDPDAVAVADTVTESPGVPAVEAVATDDTKSDISDDGEAGTDAVSTAGDKDVAPESDLKVTEPVATETPVEKPAEPAWHDADVKSLAKSYGLSDDELGEFGSKAEFTRATRLIDRQLAARRPVAEAQPTEKPESRPVETPAEKQGSLADRMKAKGFDDDSIEIARQLEETKRQVQHMSAQSQQAEIQRQAEFFHSMVDGMSEKRFGRTITSDGRPVRLSDSNNDNRRKLYEAAETIAAGINARAQQLGRKPNFPPFSDLMRQAESMAFADEIRAEDRATLVKQVAAQSKNRRPVAGSRPTASGGVVRQPTPDDSVDSIVSRVTSAWRDRSAA